MRRLTVTAVCGLLALGAWAHGAAAGFDQGKREAVAALAPRGVVVMVDPGQCRLLPVGAPLPGAASVRYRAHFVTLVVPDDGRR